MSADAFSSGPSGSLGTFSADSEMQREAQRAKGAFYTPTDLARSLVAWAIQQPGGRVLDPAVGEGALLGAAAARIKALGGNTSARTLLGIDIDGSALVRARSSLRSQNAPAILRNADFLSLDPHDVGGRFNTVITNPPYIRHHRLGFRAKRRGRLAASMAGVDLADTASSWAHFLVHALKFVAPGGRLAAIAPGSILHADYAEPVREALRAAFDDVHILLLESRVWSSVQENTVIVLGAGRGGTGGAIRVGTAINRAFSARTLSQQTRDAGSSVGEAAWVRATLSGASMALYDRASSQFERLGNLAKIRIGAVTGANKFFLLRPSDVEELSLGRLATRPIIARAAHLPGLVLTKRDFNAFSREDSRVLLLDPPSESRWTVGVSDYLHEGESQRIHRRFKCRTRDPWYRVPLVIVPDAFLSYMNWTFPRLVVNEAALPCTNTIHTVCWKRKVSRSEAKRIALALMTSLSQLSAELEGRSYGGGVLKLEPSEASRLVVPMEVGAEVHFDKVDRLLRQGQDVEATQVANRICLRPHFSPKEIERIAETVEVLRQRRWARK